MVSSEKPREVNNPAALLAFCERADNTADYVARTGIWIKENFPGSAPVLLPKLRKIYAEKRKRERDRK